MSTYRQASAYKAAAVTTATPGSLLLMLYDGALKFMRIADKAFEEEDPLAYNQTIHNNLIKAQNIVRELRSALIGGDDQERIDLVNNLIALYDYFDRRLQEANVKKDREIVQEVITRMSELRGAWDESFEKEKLNQTTGNGQPAPGTQKPAGGDAPRLSLMG